MHGTPSFTLFPSNIVFYNYICGPVPIKDTQTSPTSEMAIYTRKMENVLKRMNNKFSDLCDFLFFELWSILYSKFTKSSKSSELRRSAQQYSGNVPGFLLHCFERFEFDPRDVQQLFGTPFSKVSLR